MKLVAIQGSPRGMIGHTGTLLNTFLDAAKQAGAETELFLLNDKTISPCNGCIEICHTKGKCFREDDFEKMENAMLEADGIILASPNYTLSVTAHMKAFLDRCVLINHCQRLNGKYTAFVITGGGSDPATVENYLKDVIFSSWGSWYLGYVSTVQAQMEDPDEQKDVLASATALGKRMVTAIENKETIPEQEADIKQCFEMFKYMSIMLKDSWPVPWEYWNTHEDLSKL